MSNLLDNIFINLKIISKIPENGRISTTSAGQVYIVKDNIQSTVMRRLTGDSRDNTVKFLMGLINDTSQISNNIIKSLYIAKNHEQEQTNNTVILSQINENAERTHQLSKLVRELKSAKRGIKALHTTYNRDATVSSKLEEILDKVDLQVAKIDKALMIVQAGDKNIVEGMKRKNMNSARPASSTSNVVDNSDSQSESDDEDPNNYSLNF